MAIEEYNTYGSTSAVPVNKVIRNTFMLLSMTLAFSAFTAFISAAMGLGRMNIFVFLIGAYGLMFLTHKTQNSIWGLVSAFAFTGFMGFTIGPVVSMYLSLPNGGQVVTTALASTAVIFLALSGYALTSKKDFSFLSGFMFVGFLVLVGAMIAGFFFSIPGLSLMISAGFVLFASAAILYETSQLVHDGQRNYIMATIGLYVSIYNLFMSLLHLTGALSGDD
ncbi:Bax inhibitor-1/YccA family protein [Oceanospirillum linum]|uniref:BAX inhibitor protein n=1 Tax=Oceanospirillum linum TaxID=966 RepID=A0A1T1HD59_OCELI|nr:Bax inhibitor-1/YccA family protein [Oceanospirillum linum]OOV87753.1 BAX inhibitor protein [Oceanospirillum linum]SEG13398.1 modulator of FtsH protease [Oleiphilus messinensis]SMP10304.1 modulator of FtsH protease [Oceanospirillum linum]